MANQNDQRESMLNRAWSGVEGVAERATQLPQNATQYTQQAPFTASLVSFGVGVGLGLLVAQLLIPERRQSRWYDSYLGCDRARSIEDMAHRYLPESLSRRMGV